MKKTYSQRWGRLNRAEGIRWGNLARMQKSTTEEEEAYERAKGISHGMTKNKQQTRLLVVWKRVMHFCLYAFVWASVIGGIYLTYDLTWSFSLLCDLLCLIDECM